MAAMPSLHSSSPNQAHMPIFTYHSLIFFLCLLLHLISIVASAHFYSDVEDTEGIKIDLFPEVLRDEAAARLNELGKISDTDGYLERTYMSPASIRASNLIRGWMEEAGLRTWVDLMGNVHGRVEGMNTSAKALLIGSHLDTVIDAGIFDGALGIISALSALKVLNINGQLGKLRRPVEVIAFSDEEGVRFQSTFLGSAALAGVLPVSVLQIQDKSGVTLQNVLKENSIEISDESFFGLKYDPEAVWGYIEVHIEQGPVLESVGLPLGVVKGIAGQTRLKVTVRGSQGHAGTVPMTMRQDPMAAAAELIMLLEGLCKHPDEYLSYDGQCEGFTVESLAGSLVCTVGEISCWPSASNVIPGEHDANAVACDTGLSSQLKSATYATMKRMAGEVLDDVPVLMSGAGHDAMAMSHLTKVGMLFVRCRGGVSHSPAELVLDDDVWAAGLAILSFLESQL
ncbi:allantoate deiminase 2 isoform X3 [Actinidia eriantha]|uniref:allantoate deiminase 2 isoform X3 n=1 Tax=Actinidia eriantha TaxID=165200 RepID=UPI00258AACA4|nr:allantoate deiminase 2 isoform X3 [Actinidia eriantha]